MPVRVCIVFLGLVSAGVLGAQTSTSSSTQSDPGASSQTGSAQQPPTQGGTSSSSPSGESKSVYVRRFSAGATLSVQGLTSVTGGSSTVTASPNLSTDYTTKGASQRIGYGITGQVVITNHFAVTAGALLQRIGYQFTTSVTVGTPTFSGGTTFTTTSTHEDTRARLIEVPLLLRYYGKSRHEKGPRWFAEGGGAWRDVNRIRTSIDATDANGKVTCCTSTPAQPAHHNSLGYSAGAGLQLIDPLGIRVVPEVRYIRWRDPIFNNQTTHMQKNQVEAGISLTF